MGSVMKWFRRLMHRLSDSAALRNIYFNMEVKNLRLTKEKIL